jgi:hypothetical protein
MKCMFYLCNINLKQYIMKTLLVVQYNDYYGGGKDKSYETIVESEEQFYLWLEEHNKEREANGNGPEDEDEFDLIELELFEAQPRFLCNGCREPFLKEDIKTYEDGDDYCESCR